MIKALSKTNSKYLSFVDEKMDPKYVRYVAIETEVKKKLKNQRFNPKRKIFVDEDGSPMQKVGPAPYKTPLPSGKKRPNPAKMMAMDLNAVIGQ